MKDRTVNRKRHNINIILKQILDQHLSISIEDIELFTQVYYPIALLEMDLKEVTFEDFELIQLSILNLYYLGTHKSEEIASLLGIPVSYVEQTIGLMCGYGYIENGCVTELGVKSLVEKRKIGSNAIRQRLFADALTCDLIQIQQQPFEETLIERDYLSNNIVCIPHEEGTTEEYINYQLSQRDFTEYKKYKGDVLNSNVSDVYNVECVDLVYINAYLMKLQNISEPLIFVNYWDKHSSDVKRKNTWQPVRLPSENVRRMYGFHSDLDIYSENSLSIIEDLYILICNHLREIDAESVLKTLKAEYPFEIDASDIKIGRIINGAPERVLVYVNDNSFPIWNSFVFDFLKNFDPIKGFLCTYPKMKGLMIRFESNNATIIDLSKKIKYLERKGWGKKCQYKINDEIYSKLKDDEKNNQMDWEKITSIVEKLIEEFKRERNQ